MEIPGELRRSQAALSDYLRLARFDHVTKQIFIFPGIALAIAFRGIQNNNLIEQVILGLICAVFVASANYIINEWLDREFDKFHPTKSARVSVQVDLNSRTVYAIWVAFLIIGLSAAAFASRSMLVVGVLFALQGVIYNVPPIRTKDVPIFDVISESINNPFRLLIGWLMIDSTTLPPISILAAYWLGGAFLMAAKRLSEYREIVASHGKELLERYRKSFSGYTEPKLMASCFGYALLSTGLFSIFLIKYRIEYVIALPFLALLFSIYLAISMRAGSVAQAPERLFQNRRLMLGAAALFVVLIACTFIDIPALKPLTEQRFISLQ
jgi:4-hydroxybenzoate polyprenyltransferase